MRSSLLRNNCDGTFTDVTEAAAWPLHRLSNRGLADIDNDGLLDLFIGNEQGPSRLYHNRAMAPSKISRLLPASIESPSPKASSPPTTTTTASSISTSPISAATISYITTTTTAHSPKWARRPACRLPG